MSTVSEASPGPVLRYETFVEEQLGRARRRIRALDLAAAGLGFLIITLAYGLITAVLDRLLALPPVVRQVAFVLYVLGALTYLGVTVVVPLCRQINPYFAALQVEHSLPGTKNSVINWLDLRRQQLPVAIQGAVIHRAARELARADLDQAISAKRAGWLGGALFGLVLALLVLFLLGPRQFYSLMGRAFAPFNASPMATRTFIRVIQPAEGDAVVPVGRAVTITAQVEGNVPATTSPNAIRLLLRYQPDDPYEERLLRRGEESGEWTILVSAPDVHNGFWYKVAGGDAETPEYHIQVRSTPLLTDFSATYQFRPYVNRADETTREPNLEALRGTEVTLVARTNREVASGSLAIDGETPIAADLVASDPQALSFHFTIEKDATYRIWFTSADNEKNTEPALYSIRALPDHAPHVELTKPGKDISLPANGLLRLAGVAEDDFGLTRLTLKIRVDAVQSRPYRNGKSFRPTGGIHPRKLNYKDFVELDKLLQKDGQHLLPGMTIEYWLEAVDNCDYPSANVGNSEHFKVKITDPEQDTGKRQKDLEQAAKEKQAADQNQDQELKDSDQGNPQKENGEQSQKESGEQAKNDEQKLEDQAEKLRRALGDQDKSDKDKGSSSEAGDQPPDKQKGQDGRDRRDPSQNRNADGDSSQKKDQPKDDKGQNEQQKNSSAKRGDQSGDRQPDGSAAQKPSENGNQPGDRQEKKGDQKDNQSKGDKGNDRGSGQGDQKGDQPKGDQTDNGNQPGNQAKGDKTAGQSKGAKGDQPGSGEGAEKDGEPKRGKTGDQQGDKGKQERSQSKDDKSDAQSKENKGGEHRPGDGARSNGEPQGHKAGDQQGDKGKQGQGQSKGDKSDAQSKGTKRGEQGGDNPAKKDGESKGDKPGAQQGDNGNQEQGQSKGDKTDAQSKENKGSEQGQGDGAKKKGESQRDKPGDRQGDNGKPERSQSKGDKSDSPSKGNEGGERRPGDVPKKAGEPQPDKAGDQQGDKGNQEQGKSKSDKSDAQSKEGKGREQGQGDGAKKNGESQRDPAGNQQGDKGKQEHGQSKGDKSDAQSKGNEGDENSPGDGAKKDGEPQRDKAGDQQGDKGKQERGQSKGDKSDAQPKENKNGERNAGGGDDKNSQPKADRNPDQKGDGKKDSQNSSPGGDKDGERAKGDRKEQPTSKSGGGDPREDEKKTTNKGQEGAEQRKAEKPAGEKGQGGGDEKQSGKPNVEELIKALKNGDATARRDAARKLSDIKDQIDDPRLRQAAEEALRSSGEGAQHSKSGQRAENQAKDSGESPDGRREPEKPTKEDADGKGEKTDAGKKAARGDHRADGNGAGEQTPQSRRDGRGPAVGDNGRRQDSTAVNSNEPPEAGQAANAKYQKRAGALQLEDLKKKVNKDVLKKANMTPEEYQQFLKAYQEMLKRKESEVGNEEKLTDPNAASRRLGSMKSRAGAAPKGKADDLQHGDTSLPPPEFREGYPEFTRKLSELERTREGQKPGSK